MKALIEFIINLLTHITQAPKSDDNPTQPLQTPVVNKKTIICKRPNLSNVKEFVDNFAQSALNAEAKTGISALAMLGQVAQETGWGKHILKVTENGTQIVSNNLFNIKANPSWKGRKGTARVWEVVNGQKIWVDGEPFRVYNNFEESFVDYGNFIFGNPRYAKAVAVKSDYKKYIEEIRAAGFATDPNYVPAILSIIEKNFEYKEV